jgi:hypothetical protein
VALRLIGRSGHSVCSSSGRSKRKAAYWRMAGPSWG